MRTVRSIQQIPRHFTDYGEKQELQKYLLRFRVCRKPSAIKKANTGKAIRPMQRIVS